MLRVTPKFRDCAHETGPNRKRTFPTATGTGGSDNQARPLMALAPFTGIPVHSSRRHISPRDRAALYSRSKTLLLKDFLA
jgi:hypothetical protein